MVTLTITIPIMHKDITFLDDVTEATRQKVLKFVKDWNSNDKWIEVNTSGSTGKPKPIKLSKKHMKALAQATISFFNLESLIIYVLTSLPFSFTLQVFRINIQIIIFSTIR